MSITLQINPTLEQQLRKQAAQKGLGLERYVQSLLEEASVEKGRLETPNLSKKESELLQKIKLDLPADFWEKYRALVRINESKELSDEERTALIAMTDQLEAANADRMKYLIELSQLRGITLAELMTHLGITGGNYA